jgi:hypothetical protein
MPSPFDASGNTDLREYIQNNWTHVAVVDSGGSEQLRWDVAANGNASWSSGSASNPLEATLTVTGQDIQDAGGSLPVTLSRTESYKSSGASTRMGADPYTDATLEAPADEVVVTHQIEVPP